MGGEDSIEEDVYSYGIFLLEMFLGKRPIDVMFEDGLNLHKFAKTALPNRFVQTVGPILLPREVEETLTSTLAREDNNENEIQAKEETHGIGTCAKLIPMCMSARSQSLKLETCLFS